MDCNLAPEGMMSGTRAKAGIEEEAGKAETELMDTDQPDLETGVEVEIGKDHGLVEVLPVVVSSRIQLNAQGEEVELDCWIVCTPDFHRPGAADKRSKGYMSLTDNLIEDQMVCCTRSRGRYSY